jgi:hypothetical protein
MAGVTDRPFRILARRLGAALAASEMITSDTRLWNSRKSRQRMDHEGEPEPRVVQLAGADPAALAEAARRNIDLGAQIIDINMGCPAKKVCNRLCGRTHRGGRRHRGARDPWTHARRLLRGRGRVRHPAGDPRRRLDPGHRQRRYRLSPESAGCA